MTAAPEDSVLLRLTDVVRADDARTSDAALTLPFQDRRRSRLRARLDDGREVALLLPRGSALRDGDRLAPSDGGPVVVVRAAPQTLSRGQTSDPLLLARAAYHLGNRHVPVQIGSGWLAYEHDHVLDNMAVELGLAVETVVAPFEPEAGGYGRGGHAPDEAQGHADADPDPRGEPHHHPHGRHGHSRGR
jgi:urease accessory protein